MRWLITTMTDDELTVKDKMGAKKDPSSYLDSFERTLARTRVTFCTIHWIICWRFSLMTWFMVVWY